MATKGGAEVLGRKDIGSLEVNKAADIIIIDLKDISFAGCEDPIVAIVCCGNSSFVKYTIINGQIVFKDGIISTVDDERTRLKANILSKEIRDKEIGLRSIN